MAAEEPRACTKCGEVKGADEYYWHKRGVRRQSHCKTCKNDTDRAYYLANKRKVCARVAARKADLIAMDPEAYREKSRAQAAKYRAQGGDALRERQRAWARANPEVIRAKRIRKRMAESNVDFYEEFDIGDLIDRDGATCAWCGVDVAVTGFYHGRLDYASIDHIVPIDLGGDHLMSNCVVACVSCNARKRNLPLLEWLDVLAMAGASDSTPCKDGTT